MASTKPSGALADLYEGRIGTPTTDDEVRGYWVFALGVLLGVVGVVLFALTEPRTGARAVGYAFVALSPPFVMIGAIIRFPLRRSATTLAAIGGFLTVAAVVYFFVVFPDGWSRSTGNAVVNALYAAGVVIIGLAGAIVPLVTDPVREDYERMQSASADAESAREETATELAETAEELDAATADLAAAEARAAELDDELTAANAEVEALRSSKARFELFEDRAGKARWRLRHRNGNVIATAGQGYSSRGKAQQGLHSVKRNALGAGLLRIETPPAEAAAIADDDGPEPRRRRPERGRRPREPGDVRAVRGQRRRVPMAAQTRQRQRHRRLRRGVRLEVEREARALAGPRTRRRRRLPPGRPGRLRAVPRPSRRVALAAHPRERQRPRGLRRGVQLPDEGPTGGRQRALERRRRRRRRAVRAVSTGKRRTR